MLTDGWVCRGGQGLSMLTDGWVCRGVAASLISAYAFGLIAPTLAASGTIVAVDLLMGAVVAENAAAGAMARAFVAEYGLIVPCASSGSIRLADSVTVSDGTISPIESTASLVPRSCSGSIVPVIASAGTLGEMFQTGTIVPLSPPSGALKEDP